MVEKFQKKFNFLNNYEKVRNQKTEFYFIGQNNVFKTKT
jgi:hypothetical protein